MIHIKMIFSANACFWDKGTKAQIIA